MPIMNYTTEIAVSKTMGEIQDSLARRGVRSISTILDDEGRPAGLGFVMDTDYGLREFELPVKTEGVLAAMRNDPKVPKAKQNPEQAARVAWRIAADWLKAQAALIDAQLATLDEVMMPYMVARHAGGRPVTMYAAFRERQLSLTDGTETKS
ncbi:MAG: hypothetical protein J0J04_07690 [Microbacterium sp.]|uniref:hypothetical protein n=1 Tax=Microbacterium sp. TaxID=51671 RepID=UPI001AD1FCC1|nr:hypothetical protein [Microbacterium sp.]MBN9214680.1 hypothetical protein [Microbacterium sp.]